MKNLLHYCNTLLLVGCLGLFLMTQLSHAAPVPPEPAAGFMADTKYRVAQARHKVANWTRVNGRRIYTNHRRRIRDAAFAWFTLNALVLLTGWLLPRRPGDKISLEVNGGRVSIAVRALEDSLHRVLRQDPNIKDAKVKVVPGRGHVTVRAALTLIENANLPAMEEAILERLRHHFEVIFPADEPVTYEVDIQKLRASGVSGAGSFPAAPAPAAIPPRPENPVEQPRYPSNNEENPTS